MSLYSLAQYKQLLTMKYSTKKSNNKPVSRPASNNKLRVTSLGLLCLSAPFANAAAVAIIEPGDAIVGIDSDGDGITSKWSNFKERLIDGNTTGGSTKALWGNALNGGFIITPTNSGVLESFQLWTGNDETDRDPTSWALYGTNDAITSVDNDTGNAENWTAIDSGSLSLPSARSTASGLISITGNTTAYTSYKILFPTITAGTDMQLNELQFYATPVPEPSSAILLGLGSLALLRRRRA